MTFFFRGPHATIGQMSWTLALMVACLSAADGAARRPFDSRASMLAQGRPDSRAGVLAQGRPDSRAGVLAQGRPDAPTIAALEADVASTPSDVGRRRRLADAYAAAGRPMDAVNELRKVTEIAPTAAAGWYALGHAYNAIAQDAMRTFGEAAGDELWRLLLTADGLLAHGHLEDAFAIYRRALEQMPSMVSIHDSVAQIYERSGHAAWAARERANGMGSPVDCAQRKALCEFRAGRFEAALSAAQAQSDPESRYWRARAATELALSAFRRLDSIADSPERRAVRATVARAEERYTDAIAELKAALAFAPGDPALLYELGSAYYAARDFEQAVATLSELRRKRPDDPRLLELVGYSLLQLRRPEEALPLLQQAVQRNPAAAGPRRALGRAYLQKGDFTAAIPLIEEQLADDEDGSVHIQLARAYVSLGQREKAAALLARAEEIERAARGRAETAARRTITAPK